MNLPIYSVNSNLHAFTHRIGEQRLGYFAIWSCVFALGKAIKKYYVSSSNEYEEIKAFSKFMKDFDMAEFCESYLVPLIRTENVELIIDGCQYRRTQKTENIADWKIAQKYLNVCINSKDGTNCSRCSKCMRTLIPLDAMGKLDKFTDSFDLDTYRKYLPRWKCYFVANSKKQGFSEDITMYCFAHRYDMPLRIIAVPYTFLWRCVTFLKRKFKL